MRPSPIRGPGARALQHSREQYADGLRGAQLQGSRRPADENHLEDPDASSESSDWSESDGGDELSACTRIHDAVTGRALAESVALGVYSDGAQVLAGWLRVESLEGVDDSPPIDTAMGNTWNSPGGTVEDGNAIPIRPIYDQQTGDRIIARAAIAEVDEGMVLRERSDERIAGIWAGSSEAPMHALYFVSDTHIALDASGEIRDLELDLQRCRADLARTGGQYRGSIAVAPEAFVRMRRRELRNECLAEVTQGDVLDLTQQAVMRARQRYEERGCEDRIRSEVQDYVGRARDFALRHDLQYEELRADSLLLGRSGHITNFPRNTTDEDTDSNGSDPTRFA